MAFSPPITLSKDRVIPGLPAGIILKRPLYAAGVSAASPDVSSPSTPINKGSVDKTFDFSEKLSKKESSKTHDSIDKLKRNSKDSQGSQEKCNTPSVAPKNVSEKEPKLNSSSIQETEKNSSVTELIIKGNSGENPIDTEERAPICKGVKDDDLR